MARKANTLRAVLSALVLATGAESHAQADDLSATRDAAVEALSTIWLLGYGEFRIEGCVVSQTATTNRRDRGFVVHDAAFNLADLQPIENIRADQVFEMRGDQQFARADLLLQPERSGALAALTIAFLSTRTIGAQDYVAEFVASFGDEAAMEDLLERAATSLQRDRDRLLNDPVWQDLAAFRQVTLEVDGENGRQSVTVDFAVGHQNGNRFDPLRPPSLWGPADELDQALLHLAAIQREICPPPS